jgi:hypothetical protein
MNGDGEVHWMMTAGVLLIVSSALFAITARLLPIFDPTALAWGVVPPVLAGLGLLYVGTTRRR